MVQWVKNPPAIQETQVRSLDQEDPLEKEMAPGPVLLPGKSYGQRSLVGYNPWGHKALDRTEATEHIHLLWSKSSEGKKDYFHNPCTQQKQ